MVQKRRREQGEGKHSVKSLAEAMSMRFPQLTCGERDEREREREGEGRRDKGKPKTDGRNLTGDVRMHHRDNAYHGIVRLCGCQRCMVV
jgi:hypothetical protein